MRTVFADTFYFIAQFHSSDDSYLKAADLTNSFVGRMVTTDWVMVELADAFARLIASDSWPYISNYPRWPLSA